MRLEELESCAYIIRFSESGLGQGIRNADFGMENRKQRSCVSGKKTVNGFNLGGYHYGAAPGEIEEQKDLIPVRSKMLTGRASMANMALS